MARCDHAEFKADARIDRLTDKEGGPVIGYTCELKVICAKCGLHFRFLGDKFGSSPHEPRLSADALTLRAPIEPAYTTEILGQPIGPKGSA